MNTNYNFYLTTLFTNSSRTNDNVLFENDLAAFEFVETLLQQIGTDLQPFSDDQVAVGISYIFNNSFSNISHQFKEAKVKPERKVKAIASLFNLFREVFESRCQPERSAFTKKKISELNTVCYMFWDVTPLSTWLEINNEAEMLQFALSHLVDIDSLDLPDTIKEQMRKQLPPSDTPAKSPEEMLANMQQQYQSMNDETKNYYQAIAEVMQQCLYLNNPACVESGIHGLGHLKETLPDIACPILDEFLESRKDQDKVLMQYAQSARFGFIQ